jgi:error-prone DNA polymerase
LTEGPAYAELHALSNFTFLRGASHPDELVDRAAELGYSALALTDECSLAGAVRAHMAAKEKKLKLLLGSELRLQDGPSLLCLAKDREGYGNLCALLTRGRRSAEKGQYRLLREDLAGGLSGCLALFLPSLTPSPEEAHWVAENFPGRAWLAVELLRGPDDRARLARLQELGAQAGLPLTAAGDVHLHVPERQPLQDVLTAIRLRTTVASAGHALHPNRERHLRPRVLLARLYPPALLEETLRIAEACRFSLEELRYEYPEEVVPPGEVPSEYLRRLTEEGVRRRWPQGASEKVRRQVEHELALISELRYERYFLTVYDIVRFARSHGILCQGRGSAANSAVCFCLGITEVDPALQETLFERFISRERNEPPDIDIDFEHDRREEVIQYVYGKYGRDRAALAATVITYRPKSALRDVGKALGLELDQVDRIAKALAWWDRAESLPERLREAGFSPENPLVSRLLRLARELLGFPRHLSQHVGGFVISRGPLERMVPIENAAMPDRTVIEWDKDDLDALGLLKVDLLALGMLTALHKALDLLAELRPRPGGEALTLAEIPKEDAKVYAMIRRADTVGVFQIESRAQMAMLPRLKPQTFYDLVIQVAIVRPGPIQGQMVHPYLKRRANRGEVTYPSPEVKEVLERTLGVPIFQEQAMKLAMVAAGFTPGEADQLRRAMAAWRRKGGIGAFEDKLRRGMRERGYPEEFARQIFQQLQGFAEYGFPESHAASFALLAYASAWLKCHEPAVFACALLNSQPMGFYLPSQLVQDARRNAVVVHPVDVSRSLWDCTLEPGRGRNPALRLGLRLVKGLSEAGGRGLVKAREAGPFGNVEELSQRCRLTRKDLQCLADAGALSSLAGHRRLARWAALGADPDPLPLFRGFSDRENLPALPPPSPVEDLDSDYDAVGLTLGPHPLTFLRPRFTRGKILSSADLGRVPHGRRIRTAGLVICRQRPDTASGVTFVTLEDEGGFINLVVRKELAERRRVPLLSARLLGVTGIWERLEGVQHVLAHELEDLSPLLGELKTRSRDFC